MKYLFTDETLITFARLRKTKIRLEGNSKYFPNCQTYVALQPSVSVCNQRHISDLCLTEHKRPSYTYKVSSPQEFRIDDKHWLLKPAPSIDVLPLSPFSFIGTSSRCLWISLFSALLTLAVSKVASNDARLCREISTTSPAATLYIIRIFDVLVQIFVVLVSFLPAFMSIPKYKLHACIQIIMTIEKKGITFVCQFKSNRYKIYYLLTRFVSRISKLISWQNGKHVLMHTFLSEKCYQPFLNIQRYYLSSSLFICVFLLWTSSSFIYTEIRNVEESSFRYSSGFFVDFRVVSFFLGVSQRFASWWLSSNSLPAAFGFFTLLLAINFSVL